MIPSALYAYAVGDRQRMGRAKAEHLQALIDWLLLHLQCPNIVWIIDALDICSNDYKNLY